MIRFLHVSDFHLKGKQKRVESFDQDQVTESMAEYVGRLAAKGLALDFVVVTGDLAFQAREEEYEAAGKMCGDLLGAVSLDKERLFVVPGNHDVDRGKVDPLDIERVYSFKTQKDITGLISHKFMFPCLMDKFAAFNDFARTAMGRELFDEKRFRYTETIEIRKDGGACSINMLGLNSALFSGYDGDDRQKLALGIFQTGTALKEADRNADLSIAFFHHPFSCFHPCDRDARNMLADGVDIVLTGHTHEPDNRFTADAAGNMVHIGAGASCEKRESDNSFDIVEIDLASGKGRAQFYAYVSEHRTWVKNNRVNPRTEGVFEFAVRPGGNSGGGPGSGGGGGGPSGGGGGGQRRVTVENSKVGVIADHVTIYGDINIGGKTSDRDDSENKTDLRNSYLSHLVKETGSLALKGIDPKAAGSRSESRLRLQAVYTALMTRGGGLEGRDLFGSKGKVETVSALALLDKESRLVLLGEPGSGKSTFVDFVCLCLAGELLGIPDANLDRMTAPPPDDDGKDSEERQSWEHGPLLPVRIVLRDFAAWEGFLKKDGDDASSEDVWRYIAHRLKKAALEEFASVLKEDLLKPGVVVMFDGLDEAPDTQRHRGRIKRAVEDFAASFPQCRILVTCRTYAYQKQEWKIDMPGVTEALLSPFTRGQIHRFIDNWYLHVAELDVRDKEDALGDAERLRKAVFAFKHLMDLAERPLLLTLIASLHAWRGGSLPENREQLYADALDLLLDYWESPKKKPDANGKTILCQPSLVEWLKLKDRKMMRRFLNKLAFDVHNRQQDPAVSEETADIPEEELVAGMLRLSDDPELKHGLLVRYLSDRAGVIVPRGQHVYAFPHRTFQEYLAACHLTDTNYPCLMAELAKKDPERWREAALLAGAKAMRGTETALWNLVEYLCCRDHKCPQATMEDVWGAQIAGQLLAENVNSLNFDKVTTPKLDKVKSWLLDIMGGDSLPASERAVAGNSLSDLGDPRFDPGSWLLPEGEVFGFVKVEAGSFLMGSTREEVDSLKSRIPESLDKNTIEIVEAFYESEFPRHTVEMSAYRIAPYPVTAGQFRLFIQDAGRKIDKKWEVDNRYDNHPVTMVSWEDAVAYCEWLSEKMKERGLPWTVSLPTEAQWEKAARGCHASMYPWGDEKIDGEKANYYDTGIGSTCSVGCFPKGKSPCGAYDMVGNVLEWCRDSCAWDSKKKRFVTDTYCEGVADPECTKCSVVPNGTWRNPSTNPGNKLPGYCLSSLTGLWGKKQGTPPFHRVRPECVPLFPKIFPNGNKNKMPATTAVIPLARNSTGVSYRS